MPINEALVVLMSFDAEDDFALKIYIHFLFFRDPVSELVASTPFCGQRVQILSEITGRMAIEKVLVH